VQSLAHWRAWLLVEPPLIPVGAVTFNWLDWDDIRHGWHLCLAWIECTGTSVTPWTGLMRYKSLALKRARMNLFRFCFWILSRRRCVGNVGIPKGFPSGGGRVESRHFGFPCFPLLVISNAHACQCEVGSSAIITDAKRVCEDSSRLVCEKTRARLLQSSRFHHLCRFISWESEALDERPHALFLTAARKSLGSC
jgi:hypothetical protein